MVHRTSLSGLERSSGTKRLAELAVGARAHDKSVHSVCHADVGNGHVSVRWAGCAERDRRASEERLLQFRAAAAEGRTVDICKMFSIRSLYPACPRGVSRLASIDKKQGRRLRVRLAGWALGAPRDPLYGHYDP
jgi:hypothetical protein